MIETPRLRLRGWRNADETPFARATNTPAVMAHLGGVQPPASFAGLAASFRATEAEAGFCFWVMERRADGALLGFCGLEPVDVANVRISNDVEIGWRLREDAWGQGYAREAAEAVLAWGWANTGLARIVALTVSANRRSWGLMERLGMTRTPALGFNHPEFARGHPLRTHLVYAMSRPRLSRAVRPAPAAPAHPRPAIR